MATQFQHLFSPLTMRNVTVRNRILSTGHATNLCEGGMPTERLASYHRERAKGGVGLIILECSMVHPTTRFLNLPVAYDEKVIPGFRKVTSAVHEHGAKIFCQVGSVGRQMPSIYTDLPLWAPSAIPCVVNREVPKEMEKEDIEEIVAYWARGARNVREGGFDGVEIHSGYGGYLLCQFLSPYSNRRQDEYGGSLENRLRIVLEVIEAVRGEVGDDYVVGMQLDGDEFTPGGLSLMDFQEIAQRLEATGQLDYLTIKAGTYYVANMIIPDSQTPLGLWLPLAAGIKEAVKTLPIFAVGRINDPLMAEKVLADGHADMVGMTRAQLCDPYMAQKARQGKFDEIRTCIACNQGCQTKIFLGLPITCTQNPAVGKEQEYGMDRLKPASRRKKVLVIGGGPAGMKAAEVAAMRGHRVLLWEREKELGGQVSVAARIPQREEFGGLVRHLKGQLERLSVEVSLGLEADAEMVLKESPDAVIVATGSYPVRSGFLGLRPDIDPIPGTEQEHVISAYELLKDARPTGQRVLVVDGGEAHWKGLALTEYLRDQGKEVEITSPTFFVGYGLPWMSLIPLYPRLFEKGIALSPFTALKEVKGNSAILYNIYTNEERHKEGIDTVVLALHHKASDSLYFALKGRVKELYRVGDCVAPRTALEAIREGFEVGWRV